MSKLLFSNFARLKKSKIFWFCIVAMLGLSIFDCLLQYRDKVSGFTVTLDSIFVLPYIMSGILLAVFCSLFIGSEYSDGTIRNKLVVGRNRSSIYLANFVVSAVAGLAMNLIYLVVACILGIPLLGFFTADLQMVLVLMLVGMLITIAFAAIFTMLTMLNQNKALSAIICSIGILAAIFVASFLYSAITEPEFIESNQLEVGSSFSVSVDGLDQIAEKVPNPRYLTGNSRALVQFLVDFPPSGQMIQMVDMNMPNLSLLPFYSMIIIITANIGGVFFFRRKDLK